MGDDKQPKGLLGPLRTEGPAEKPRPVTAANVLGEAGRLTRRLALLAVVAGAAAGLGYLVGGARGAWTGAGIIVGLKLLVEPLLRALLESDLG